MGISDSRSLLLNACKYKKTEDALKIIDDYNHLKKYDNSNNNNSNDNNYEFTNLIDNNYYSSNKLKHRKNTNIQLNEHHNKEHFNCIKCNNNNNCESIINYVDIDDATPLIWACHNKMPEVALKLIETGNYKPEQLNNYNNTALMYACENKMTEVALKLIETGNSKPEQVSKNGNTALIWACENKMTDVALKLIETGNSKPEQVNEDGFTALICAYNNKMYDVMYKILLLPKSNNDFIEKQKNFICNLIKNDLIEPIKLLLKINVKFNEVNDDYLIKFLDKHNHEINGQITNPYIIKLLCYKNKTHLIEDKLLSNYLKYFTI